MSESLSWKQFCKKYQAEHGLTYGQSLTQAGPAWQSYKSNMSKSDPEAVVAAPKKERKKKNKRIDEIKKEEDDYDEITTTIIKKRKRNDEPPPHRNDAPPKVKKHRRRMEDSAQHVLPTPKPKKKVDRHAPIGTGGSSSYAATVDQGWETSSSEEEED